MWFVDYITTIYLVTESVTGDPSVPLYATGVVLKTSDGIEIIMSRLARPFCFVKHSSLNV